MDDDSSSNSNVSDQSFEMSRKLTSSRRSEGAPPIPLPNNNNGGPGTASRKPPMQEKQQLQKATKKIIEEANQQGKNGIQHQVIKPKVGLINLMEEARDPSVYETMTTTNNLTTGKKEYLAHSYTSSAYQSKDPESCIKGAATRVRKMVGSTLSGVDEAEPKRGGGFENKKIDYSLAGEGTQKGLQPQLSVSQIVEEGHSGDFGEKGEFMKTDGMIRCSSKDSSKGPRGSTAGGLGGAQKQNINFNQTVFELKRNDSRTGQDNLKGSLNEMVDPSLTAELQGISKDNKNKSHINDKIRASEIDRDPDEDYFGGHAFSKLEEDQMFGSKDFEISGEKQTPQNMAISSSFNQRGLTGLVTESRCPTQRTETDSEHGLGLNGDQSARLEISAEAAFEDLIRKASQKEMENLMMDARDDQSDHDSSEFDHGDEQSLINNYKKKKEAEMNRIIQLEENEIMVDSKKPKNSQISQRMTQNQKKSTEAEFSVQGLDQASKENSRNRGAQQHQQLDFSGLETPVKSHTSSRNMNESIKDGGASLKQLIGEIAQEKSTAKKRDSLLNQYFQKSDHASNSGYDVNSDAYQKERKSIFVRIDSSSPGCADPFIHESDKKGFNFGRSGQGKTNVNDFAERFNAMADGSNDLRNELRGVNQLQSKERKRLIEDSSFGVDFEEDEVLRRAQRLIQGVQDIPPFFKQRPSPRDENTHVLQNHRQKLQHNNDELEDQNGENDNEKSGISGLSIFRSSSSSADDKENVNTMNNANPTRRRGKSSLVSQNDSVLAKAENYLKKNKKSHKIEDLDSPQNSSDRDRREWGDREDPFRRKRSPRLTTAPNLQKKSEATMLKINKNAEDSPPRTKEESSNAKNRARDPGEDEDHNKMLYLKNKLQRMIKDLSKDIEVRENNINSKKSLMEASTKKLPGSSNQNHSKPQEASTNKSATPNDTKSLHSANLLSYSINSSECATITRTPQSSDHRYNLGKGNKEEARISPITSKDSKTDKKGNIIHSSKTAKNPSKGFKQDLETNSGTFSAQNRSLDPPCTPMTSQKNHGTGEASSSSNQSSAYSNHSKSTYSHIESLTPAISNIQLTSVIEEDYKSEDFPLYESEKDSNGQSKPKPKAKLKVPTIPNFKEIVLNRVDDDAILTFEGRNTTTDEFKKSKFTFGALDSHDFESGTIRINEINAIAGNLTLGAGSIENKMEQIKRYFSNVGGKNSQEEDLEREGEEDGDEDSDTPFYDSNGLNSSSTKNLRGERSQRLTEGVKIKMGIESIDSSQIRSSRDGLAPGVTETTIHYQQSVTTSSGADSSNNHLHAKRGGLETGKIKHLRLDQPRIDCFKKMVVEGVDVQASDLESRPSMVDLSAVKTRTSGKAGDKDEASFIEYGKYISDYLTPESQIDRIPSVISSKQQRAADVDSGHPRSKRSRMEENHPKKKHSTNEAHHKHQKRGERRAKLSKRNRAFQDGSQDYALKEMSGQDLKRESDDLSNLVSYPSEIGPDSNQIDSSSQSQQENAPSEESSSDVDVEKLRSNSRMLRNKRRLRKAEKAKKKRRAKRHPNNRAGIEIEELSSPEKTLSEHQKHHNNKKVKIALNRRSLESDASPHALELLTESGDLDQSPFLKKRKKKIHNSYRNKSIDNKVSGAGRGESRSRGHSKKLKNRTKLKRRRLEHKINKKRKVRTKDDKQQLRDTISSLEMCLEEQDTSTQNNKRKKIKRRHQDSQDEPGYKKHLDRSHKDYSNGMAQGGHLYGDHAGNQAAAGIEKTGITFGTHNFPQLNSLQPLGRPAQGSPEAAMNMNNRLITDQNNLQGSNNGHQTSSGSGHSNNNNNGTPTAPGKIIQPIYLIQPPVGHPYPYMMAQPPAMYPGYPPVNYFDPYFAQIMQRYGKRDLGGSIHPDKEELHGQSSADRRYAGLAIDDLHTPQGRGTRGGNRYTARNKDFHQPKHKGYPHHLDKEREMNSVSVYDSHDPKNQKFMMIKEYLDDRESEFLKSGSYLTPFTSNKSGTTATTPGGDGGSSRGLYQRVKDSFLAKNLANIEIVNNSRRGEERGFVKDDPQSIRRRGDVEDVYPQWEKREIETTENEVSSAFSSQNEKTTPVMSSSEEYTSESAVPLYKDMPPHEFYKHLQARKGRNQNDQNQARYGHKIQKDPRSHVQASPISDETIASSAFSKIDKGHPKFIKIQNQYKMSEQDQHEPQPHHIHQKQHRQNVRNNNYSTISSSQDQDSLPLSHQNLIRLSKEFTLGPNSSSATSHHLESTDLDDHQGITSTSEFQYHRRDYQGAGVTPSQSEVFNGGLPTPVTDSEQTDDYSEPHGRYAGNQGSKVDYLKQQELARRSPVKFTIQFSGKKSKRRRKRNSKKQQKLDYSEGDEYGQEGPDDGEFEENEPVIKDISVREAYESSRRFVKKRRGKVSERGRGGESGGYAGMEDTFGPGYKENERSYTNRRSTVEKKSRNKSKNRSTSR